MVILNDCNDAMTIKASGNFWVTSFSLSIKHRSA